MLAALKNQAILLLLSLLFLAIGAGIGIVPPIFFQRDITRVERLEPLSVTDLATRNPGDEVLIEGRISSRTPVQENGYVAYWQERRQTRDGETKWVTDRKVTPPLWLDATGGSLQVGNDTYNLGTVRDWEDTWAYGDRRRVGGLKVGDPVVAIGIVRGTNDGVALDAGVVSRGTKASYLSDQRMWIWVTGILGGVFGLVGLLLMGFAIYGIARAVMAENDTDDAFHALMPSDNAFVARGMADDELVVDDMTDDEFFSDETEEDGEAFDVETEEDELLVKDH